jgi:hypothetical protein
MAKPAKTETPAKRPPTPRKRAPRKAAAAVKSGSRRTPDEPVGLNLPAVLQTIDALCTAKQLHPTTDAARIALALSLAAACDLAPANASLWREYRAAEATLHEVRNAESDDDRELVAGMSAPVGDKPNTRAPHTRRRS